MTTSRADKLPLIAFLSLGVIWGSNFIYMKLAANLITPLQIAFFRVLCGFIPVFIFAQTRGVLRWRHLRHAGHFFVMGMLAAAVYYYGFAKGDVPAPFRCGGCSQRCNPDLFLSAGGPFH